MARTGLNKGAGAVGTGMTFLALLLLASTLRAPITAVGPMIETLRAALNLSGTEAGLITAVPLLAFGLIAPFAGLLGRRFGLERCLLVSTAIVILGVLSRSYGTSEWLFVGTTLAGIGIAVGNVLMPSVVKRDFPAKVPTVTGRCGVAIGLASAGASMIAVPLMNMYGWQVALGSAVVLPLLTFVVWASLPKRPLATPAVANGSRPKSPWSSALAWQVTAFMTINSVLFYAVITWLPSILTSHGLSTARAGSIHGFMQLGSLIPGFLLGPLVAKMKDQRLLAAVLALLQAFALAALVVIPEWSAVWAFIFSLASGGALILSLMFIGLRTSNASQAGGLSGMAQCVNFLVGALGPVFAGRAQELVGGWGAILCIGAALAVAMAVTGALAGRARTLAA